MYGKKLVFRGWNSYLSFFVSNSYFSNLFNLYWNPCIQLNEFNKAIKIVEIYKKNEHFNNKNYNISIYLLYKIIFY